MIIDFIKNNPGSLLIVGLGVLAWIITAGACLESKKTGRHISGLPGVGGLLVIIGFLTSSVKWLALIGLLDFQLLYFIVKCIPDIIMAERYEKNYVPSDEFDGGKVVAYTGFNKSYEELRYPTEYPGSFEVYVINRYFITKTGEGFRLYKIEHTDRIAAKTDCRSVDECKRLASKKALKKWVDIGRSE